MKILNEIKLKRFFLDIETAKLVNLEDAKASIKRMDL
jgi:hypothetical protein